MGRCGEVKGGEHDKNCMKIFFKIIIEEKLPNAKKRMSRSWEKSIIQIVNIKNVNHFKLLYFTGKTTYEEDPFEKLYISIPRYVLQNECL